MERLPNVFFALVYSLLLIETIKYCQCENSSISCKAREREALIEFTQSVRNISEVQVLFSWEGKDCCKWEGVLCDSRGHVVKLDLLGKFPHVYLLDLPELNSCLLKLKHLTYLDLSNNYFKYHPIPNIFGSMKRLTYLNLSYAHISGMVPYQLGNLTSLQFLDLSGISFGKIKRNFVPVLNTLPSLIHLGLSSCGLNYLHIPNAAVNSTSLATLQFLDLSFNEFYGPIPLALRNMNSLRVLDLSLNLFGSAIPHWFGNFKSLVHLFLYVNNFSTTLGPVVSILSNTCDLKTLDLEDNLLHEEFPEKVPGCFGRVLETLSLSENIIGGVLPYWLGELKYLKYLDLRQNALSGPIPFSLGRLSSLRELHLSSNHLNGTIPDSVGQLVNLNYLDVSFNSLEGIISHAHLGNLSFLTDLVLSHNKLEVGLKFNWIPPFQLKRIEMSNCAIGTQFPLWLQKQTQVIGLDLSENIGKFMPNMEKLVLHNNFMSGSIPNSLCTMEFLGLMDLSNNKFSGTIPDCWSDSQSMLQVNDLSSNNLSGVIPSSIGRISSLGWLFMSSNNISGELPPGMRDFNELLILDISENKLYGKIPTWIGKNLASLQILNLRDNNFHGKVPLQLCLLSHLHILDLANNNLTGRIPRCFGQLRRMISEPEFFVSFFFEEWGVIRLKQVIKGIELEYTTNIRCVVNMDLSCNHLVGLIPQELTFLIALDSLNLSFNHLSGEIPKNIGKFNNSLEGLDLSNNLLNGSIPPSISELTFLSHLNLSHNNFSGKIPRGNQLQTLDDPTIYIGNKYLCGAPLPNKCVGDHEPNGAPPDEDNGEEMEGISEKIWFYLVILAGFASGFWGVIGTLLLNKSWRWAYFQYVEEMDDNIHVAIVVKWARLKRMIWKENTQA
ncbi:putative Leucine-rich receptor-like kinase family protein [Quillaja saponaria]|uniref:Leucine-rich receptor-like kinase family protein n=1 Tax=Quillaja saponaria TaxID=32244 RepID=A0AAD7M5M1_QUISA|nr:putative Leucine-rich receptor-like kinase family protein [Quillaja saponaria]